MDMELMRVKCPKCRGELLIEQDYHGWYEHCLYCGYNHDLQNIGEIAQHGKTNVAVKYAGTK